MANAHQKPDQVSGRSSWHHNLVARKFYLIVFLFVVIVLCLLALGRFQGYVLDSLRAYVAGEGFWSKGQKDAIYHLLRYGISFDEAEYELYLKGLTASLGDKQARLAMQAIPPDIELARQGALKGRNHPDDIDNLISLFLNFKEVVFMKKAIEIWTEGDAQIDELQRLGQELHAAVQSGQPDAEQIKDIMIRVDRMNTQVADLEDRFSATLGDAARQIAQLTRWAMTIATLLLLAAGIGLSRQIVKGLRQTQAELQASEARFRHVVESNIIGIVFWQADGTITDANDAFLDIIGYSRSELADGAVNWRALTPDEYAAADAEALQQIHDQGFCTPYEKELLHKNAHRITIYLGAARFDSSDRAGVCFVLDISERKQAEQAQRLAAAVFQATQEAIFVTDTTPAIKVVNPAFERITGYSQEEVLGRNPRMLGSGTHDHEFYREMWESLNRSGAWKGEIRNRRKSGELFQAWLSISVIRNDKGEVSEYVGVFSDITELRKLEEQLQQAQKMEAVGTLVGGIAHDFNNTLAAVQGSLFLAKKYNEDNDPMRVAEKLKIIERLSDHSGEMVAQLMTFARKGIVRMAPLSLNEIFGDMKVLAPSILPENIAFECVVCDEELCIRGDAAQLQQVLLNLLNNARDAVAQMPRPAISCRLEHFDPDTSFAEAHPELAAGALAHVAVTDNGCGIEEENLEHIFEPFYTTKGVGKGTGLGLAMAYGSMHTHQGVIEVKSRIGKGTSVHLYLPLIESGVDAIEAAQTVRGKVRDAGQRVVLLVDDNIPMRDVCTEALNSMGYKVLKADDGASALEVFNRHKGDISLIISDVVMPVMGGFELAKRVRKQQARLPIIFVTGYDPENMAIPNSLVEHTAILTKPYRIDVLLKQVESMLVTGTGMPTGA